MHKCVILLVKSDSKDSVIDQVSEFMEPYGDGKVWDWYVIGGRWSGTLSGKTESRDTYKQDGYSDDVMPLSDCLPIVKDWLKQYNNSKLNLVKELKTELNKIENLTLKSLDKFEIRSRLGFLSNVVYDNFCFDTNVFNTENYSCDIPKDLKGYYAVIVDMHN